MPELCMKNVIGTLKNKFEFERTGDVESIYLNNQISTTFRTHKYHLKERCVKDKEPAVLVKQGPIPPPPPMCQRKTSRHLLIIAILETQGQK
ncbi:hypothetical protein QJS04_geneDACA014773 [Acorus gramineus]|uniref:Uncharacterized protein n=1 Tax=Acorus gramineus TaxID=55184 RepID=A0AAV9BMM0_ACOGR|nr:hypothetical protein QJS04_geneDACA014773 [Acorus gramineus]